MKVEVIKIGDEAGIIIPDELLKKLNLSVGDEIDVTYDDSQKAVIVKPVSKKEVF
jgi:antitoxin component of MazEF toxin-antitoxin module